VETQALRSSMGMARAVMECAAGGCRSVPRLGCEAIDMLNTKFSQTVL